MTDLDRWTLQQLHDPVQQAVDDLEARRLVVEDGRQPPLVPGANLGRGVLHDDVGDLEQLERQRHVPVSLDGLQEAGEQRGPGYLELQSFGVGDVNRGDVLNVPPHLGGHVVSGAEREGESLGRNVSA